MRSGFAATVAVLAVAMVAAACSFGAAATAAADDDNGGGITITVTVTSASTGTATPTPSPRPTGGGSSGGNSGSGSSGGVVVPTAVPTPGPTDFSLGGILFVSGLGTQYVPSLNPAGGQVVSEFTVQNVSSYTVDSIVEFTLANPLGFELSHVRRITVLGLKPNESRVVRAVLTDPGQWAVVTAGFTITPTSLAGSSRIPSVTRNVIVFFFPWLSLVILFLALAAYATVRSARYFRERETSSEYA